MLVAARNDFFFSLIALDTVLQWHLWSAGVNLFSLIFFYKPLSQVDDPLSLSPSSKNSFSFCWIIKINFCYFAAGRFSSSLTFFFLRNLFIPFFLFSFFSFYKLQYSSRCLLSSTKQEEKHLLSVLFSNACSLHHWSI